MDKSWVQMVDDLGPDKIVLLHDSTHGIRGIVVVDNVACGPSIGGIRMSPAVTVNEVFRLARTMTMKAAAAGLSHGGGKAGLIADPRMDPIDKERVVRAFARSIRDLVDYIPGPDMGTDETSMALIHDEIGRAVGLPRVLGGIPLDEIGATAHGLVASANVAREYAGIDLDGARVVIQGFGAVGLNAARMFAELGAVVVAVADSRGAIVNPEGLDVDALVSHKRSGRSVAEFSRGKSIANENLVDLPCDIWVPAAQAAVIDASNVDRLETRLVLQGANIPVSEAAEAALHERGVLVVPDFIANAGGLICAAIEYRGGTQAQALAAIEDKIAANTREVLELATRESMLPRRAALRVAQTRVRQAMRFRRHGMPGPLGAAEMLDL